MRFGWLAAAAAMMCAGQAGAARYYEFEIVGTARVTSYDPYGALPPVINDRLSRFTASFDTTVPLTPLGYPAYGVPGTIARFFPSSGSISTLNTPGGTYFNLYFDLNRITVGETLSLISATGTYGYLDCNNRYQFCNTDVGTLYAVSARTSDVAPVFLGATESTLLTSVPEPAAWTMMIFGVGAIGSAMRRRRARVAIS